MVCIEMLSPPWIELKSNNLQVAPFQWSNKLQSGPAPMQNVATKLV